MHIQLSPDELETLDVSVLPNGATLVESISTPETFKPIKAYIVEDGKLIVTKDFVENDRAWAKGEEKEFKKGKGKAAVLDYFLSHDDNGPYREYRTMCGLEHKHLSFIRHEGSYRYLDADRKYNIFQIIINRDSDLMKVEKELSWALKKIAGFYPDVSPIELKVFEHSLSAGGIYSVLWDRDSGFELTKTTYGMTDTLKEFSSLRELIKYISVYHYYE